MTIRDQILAAIRRYKANDYQVKIFCDVFASLYFYQNGGYKSFSEKEREALDKIGFIAERCNDVQEDLAQYPNNYYSEAQAKQLIDDVLEKLNF